MDCMASSAYLPFLDCRIGPRNLEAGGGSPLAKRAVYLCIQLTAAAVTPPAEHAARQAAEAADALAGEAGIIPTVIE